MDTFMRTSTSGYSRSDVPFCFRGASLEHTILGGTDVEQAARLQMITAFMMAASTTLSCIVSTHFVLWICVDSEQHIQNNCIDNCPHVVRRAFNSVILVTIHII